MSTLSAAGDDPVSRCAMVVACVHPAALLVVQPRLVGKGVGAVAKIYAPWASSPAVRASMKGNRRRDTTPELAVRRAVYALGLRYRVDSRPLSDLNRRADLVFTAAKVAVFVDGCYWHGCPQDGTTARTNAGYWGPKIEGNRARDADTDRRLRAAGWVVVRVWEHDDPIAAAQEILGLVRVRRDKTRRGPAPER